MRQSGMWRARWLSKTVEPEPGTLGWVFPVPWAGADGWGFQLDGDDGAYLCEETDFEFVMEAETGGVEAHASLC